MNAIRLIFGYLFVLLTIFGPLSIHAQKSLPADDFGGLSTHTGARLGDLAIVDSSMASIKSQGVSVLRIELQGETALARLDSLLTLTDRHGLTVFVAVPDTMLVTLPETALPELVTAAGHRVSAYTVVFTNKVSDDMLFAAFNRLAIATPAALHGFSMPNAQHALFRQMMRLPEVDFMGLNFGYMTQRWASKDRVREAIAHVFSRMPHLVTQAVNAMELMDKPLLIDFIDYPRDNAFRTPESSVRMRDNIIHFARHQQQLHSDALRGMFLGSWVGDAESLEWQPTEALYATDTTTISILTRKSDGDVQ